MFTDILNHIPSCQNCEHIGPLSLSAVHLSNSSKQLPSHLKRIQERNPLLPKRIRLHIRHTRI